MKFNKHVCFSWFSHTWYVPFLILDNLDSTTQLSQKECAMYFIKICTTIIQKSWAYQFQLSLPTLELTQSSELKLWYAFRIKCFQLHAMPCIHCTWSLAKLLVTPPCCWKLLELLNKFILDVHHWHLFGHFGTFQSTRTLFVQIVFEFQHLLTSSDHKNWVTAHCSLLHVVSGATMWTLLVGQDNWTLKVKYVTTERGRFGAYSRMHIQQWGQSQRKNVNALQILSDLPS